MYSTSEQSQLDDNTADTANTADQSQVYINSANQWQVDGNTDDQSKLDDNTASQSQLQGTIAELFDYRTSTDLEVSACTSPLSGALWSGHHQGFRLLQVSIQCIITTLQ